MINPAPIPSELSLNAGDHDELKIFLEIFLIPSRIDQNLKFQRGVHGFLKRKLGLESWVIEHVVRAVFKSHGSGFPCMALWLQIRGEGA